MMNSLLSKSKIDVPDMLLKGTVMVLFYWGQILLKSKI